MTFLHTASTAHTLTTKFPYNNPFLALFRGSPGLRLAAENLNYFKFDDFPGLSWVFTDSVNALSRQRKGRGWLTEWDNWWRKRRRRNSVVNDKAWHRRRNYTFTHTHTHYTHIGMKKIFYEYLPILTRQGFSLPLKGKVHANCVMRCLMHGSETWPTKVEHELKLNCTEMSMIRWMCGV